VLIVLNTKTANQWYAYISAIIVKNAKNIGPVEMHGIMYYLEDHNKTWVKASINFYKVGSRKAKEIEKKIMRLTTD
jgi:hypothetical protein